MSPETVQGSHISCPFPKFGLVGLVWHAGKSHYKKERTISRPDEKDQTEGQRSLSLELG